MNLIVFFYRTKWKRQAAVSLEFLEQQGNIAAVHRLLQHHHAATGVGNPHHSSMVFTLFNTNCS